MKKSELIFKSILAGVLIGLAACIFVSCENKIVGSCLFGIGLAGVILLSAFLYTGKVGYINSKETFINALIGLAFNLAAAFCVGLLFRLGRGTQTVMDSRLAKEWYRLLLDGIGCGALIYLAVELFKISTSCIEIKGKMILIILPVMAFILAGFEHCIADAAYYGMCELTWKGLFSIFLVIIGNSIGSLVIRWLQVGYTKISK